MMGGELLNDYRFSQKFRIFAGPQVQKELYSGKLLPELCFETTVSIHVFGIVSYGL